jgi:hypothetical protein
MPGMLQSKTTGLLVGLAALTCVAVPATADADSQATFAVTIEAKRTVSWNQPRLEQPGDCKGKRYMEGRGGEEFTFNSRPGGILVVQGNPRHLTGLTFGIDGKRGSVVYGAEGKGMITRNRHWVTGWTGGWCGGAKQDPIEQGDCGTKLVPFTYRLVTSKGTIGFTETKSTSDHAREKFDFYDCDLHTPEFVPTSSLPSLEEKLSLAKLFNRRLSTVTITASKTYGPNTDPTTRLERNATYDWKMTLKRIKSLKARR